MIVFATDYDEATKGGHMVAQQFPHRMLPVETEKLFGHVATATNLRELLCACPDRPLIAFSHGKTTHLCGDNGSPAIENADGSIIGNRSLFIYACWTSDGLGQVIASHGARWWGFTGEISALPQDQRTALVLAKLIGRLINDIPNMHTPSRIRHYLEHHVSTLCRAALSELHRLHLSGHRVDPYGYYAIEHIMQRLRVWLPGEKLPVFDNSTGAPINVLRL